ncbi:hypothetical protein KSC_092460 [Ktedonobacter sp. SOSP1-52]|uniref:YncE family protein n=1 Tax=Ktedonobacter sp. SOSP1-52 TaxID=2778366 RepID=UPI001915E0FB|nr:hypothetical protein [Ktedonobacter sp. SOSP1-52]GHO70354.1 hypothetical protein KSC_092460 [Ktedonobacter sp. SOSP1-52]
MQAQYLKGSKVLTVVIFLSILGLLALLCLSHFFILSRAISTVQPTLPKVVAHRANNYKQISSIALPNASSLVFDGAYLDEAESRYYLADRDNKSIDVLDLKTNTFLYSIPGPFTGEEHNKNGPNHVLRVAPDLLAVSNGDGTVVFLSTQTKQVVGITPKLGELRADAMAFDEADHLLAVVNGDDEIPVVSFIDTSKVSQNEFPMTRLTFPEAATTGDTHGLDDIEFADGRFFLSVTGASTHPYGAVYVLQHDTSTKKVTRRREYSLPYVCNPNGLAIGAHAQLGLACSTGNSQILDLKTGKAILVPNTDSGDFVAYTHEHFFFANSNELSTDSATLAIAKADGQLIQQIALTDKSHTVTASPTTGKIYVPQQGLGIVIYGQ